MAKKHGVFISEESTAVSVPQESSTGLQVVVGTAPVNTADDPSSLVNVPVLANSAVEAMKTLGYSSDFENYTLCASMYVTNNLYQVSPVVYINVLDPTKHKKALAQTAVVVEDMQAVVKQTGILKKDLSVSMSLTQDVGAAEDTVEGGGADLDALDEEPAATVPVESVSNDGSLVEGTDYTLSFDSDGYLVITLISSGAGASATALIVSGYQLDPEAVTKEDIIGSVDVSTGKETGMEVIRQVYPKLGVVPGILIAPYWSKIAEVGIALMAKAANINGVFKGFAYPDLPTDANGARKYTDVKTVKESCGYTSAYCTPCWPCARIGEIILPYSVVAAARTAYEDAINQDVPSRSPSNIDLAITGLCLEDGTEVILDQDQATTVGEFGVMTAVNINGFKMWGNHTGAYPSSSDAKDIWITVRRMFNWQGNTFILTYFDEVDDPMNPKLVENVVDSENIRCAAYAPTHWAGASIEYLASDNPQTDILAGKVTFRQHIAPYTPAETIENILNYDTGMLQAALGGES